MIRIYALAKELKVESKYLVGICGKVGLEGKGSALASLNEDEVKRVKDYIQNASPNVTTQELLHRVDSAPMQRPSVSIHSGKIPVLRTTRPIRPQKEQDSSENNEESIVKSEEPSSEIILSKTASETPQPESASSTEIPANDSTSSAVTSAKTEEPTQPVINTAVTESVKEESPKEEKTPAEPTIETVRPHLSNMMDLSKKIPVLNFRRPLKKPQEKNPSDLSASQTDVPKTVVSKTETVQETSVSTLTKNTAETHQETISAQSVEKSVEKTVEQPAETVVKKEDTAAVLPPSESKPERISKTSPLQSLLRSRESQDKNQETPAVPVQPEHSPQDSTASAPASPVSQKTEVPQLSPLERARRAALNEMNQRPHIIGGFSGSGKKKGKDDDVKSHAPKKQVGIHLAPLPSTPEKPTKKSIPGEVAPQKPEIRLSPSVIRDAKAGNMSPLTQMIQNVQNKVAESAEAAKGRDAKKKDKKHPGELFSEAEEMLNAKKGKKSKGGKRGEELDETQTGRKRKASVTDFRLHDDDGDHYYQRQHRKKGSKSKVSTVPRKGDIVIEMPCTVKGFAEMTGLSVAVVIKKMMELGYMLTINQPMEEEIAELLIEAFELKAVIKKEQTLEDQFVSAVVEQEDPPETLRPRPPVVTFLGHVDHGKTSLLDRILHMNVVSGEKGGITQHIRSYRIKTKGGDVTFVDTPGHEAFTEMRARGANCTDIAVLVVAADDGVMPQTEEAISHIKAADVPIVVAMNKMDLPGVNRDRVVQELAGCDLMPSEWGGDVEIIETSAVTGKGIDELMETLLMVAELHELKARPDRNAAGLAIETSLEQGQGVRCTLLVQNGTLKTGDVILCGNAYGKVRAMFDTLDNSKELQEAGPSTPVVVLGLNIAPSAGSKFVVLDDISVARQIAEQRTQEIHERELTGGESHVTLETLRERLQDAKTQQTLNVIIRTDVRGSIEAIRKELSKLDHPEVKIRILQASVGGITEADVLLADASDAIIVGFNVVPDELARVTAEKKKVQIRRYDIIYKLSEDIKAALEGMLKPIEQVKELGRALVQQTFSISRIGTIAGCRVLSGTVERDCMVRIIRESRVIGEYSVDTLRHIKDDVREVREGYECGIKLKGYNDLKEGDIFEAYKIEEIARTF